MLSLKEKINLLKEWANEPDGDALWDLITCTRGPDTPSERDDMEEPDKQRAYAARRRRKADTGEVIRGLVFGSLPGAVRARTDRDYVILPPVEKRDHYDHHVERAVKAASRLGISIAIRERGPKKGEKAVKVEKAEKGEKPPSPKKKAWTYGGKSLGWFTEAPFVPGSTNQTLMDLFGLTYGDEGVKVFKTFKENPNILPVNGWLKVFKQVVETGGLNGKPGLGGSWNGANLVSVFKKYSYLGGNIQELSAKLLGMYPHHQDHIKECYTVWQEGQATQYGKLKP
jgi:hypothetical protein